MVDYVLFGAPDGHTQPQTDHMGDGFKKLLYRFESLPDMIALPHLNKSAPRTMDMSYRADELLAYYAADYAVRESL